jgi:hypothetical protein
MPQMNMSHCRFRNTDSALSECNDALEDLLTGEGEPLTIDELRAAKSLALRCIEIIELIEEHADEPFQDSDDATRRCGEIIETANSELTQHVREIENGEDDDDDEGAIAHDEVAATNATLVTEIDLRAWEASHAAGPRGYGYWKFSDKPDQETALHYTTTDDYAGACRSAAAYFAKRNVPIVYLLP